MLRQRATEPEYFDDPARTPEEITEGYRELARVNRFFRLADPYTRVMAAWLGHENCKRLSILDLGAGDGWLGHVIEAWAGGRGWQWQVTNLDMNRIGLQLSTTPRCVVGCALALPFQSGAFDVVIASQMTHHLDRDEQAVQHLREANRVARRAIFITDTQRSVFLYFILWIAARVLGLRPEMRHDGLLSIRRSWTPDEMAKLAARAGLIGATVRSYFGARVIVAAKKRCAIGESNETIEASREPGEFCSAPIGK